MQETTWKGDWVRRLAGGYKMLHVDGDGRSNGVGIITSEEINKQWSECKDGQDG